MGVGGAGTAATSAAAWALINVIMAATGDNWLDRGDGDGGTITEFDGLVIVRHSQRAHRNIEDLLAKLREKKSNTRGPTYVPGPVKPQTPSFGAPPAASVLPSDSTIVPARSPLN